MTSLASRPRKATGTKKWRVVITGDRWRFGLHGGKVVPYFQAENVAWLHGLLGGMASWKSVHVDFDALGGEATAELLFAMGKEGVLADYAANPGLAWAKRYDVVEPDLFSSRLHELASYDLVIGFELPPTIRRYLNGRGTPYLNFAIHPLRFLRDLSFGITTNCGRLQSLVDACALTARDVEAPVRRYRAMFAMQHPPAAAIPAGLPLLIGQTERDSVLIRNGRFVQWSDFEPELAEHLASYSEVVFVEHPMGSNGAAMARYLRSKLGKTVISTNANGYALIFSEPRPPMVLTLSSSLGVEASAAGLQSHFLLADPRAKAQVKDVDLQPMQCVGHAVLDDPFWQAVFLHSALAPPSAHAFALGDHFIRDSIASWSFGPLRTGLSGLTSRKTIWPAVGLDEQRFCALVAASAARPDMAGAGFSAIVDTARAAGIDLVATPPLRCDETRNVFLGGTAALPCLISGFHPPEEWGCWSYAHLCSIELLVSQQDDSHDGLLEFKIPIRIFPGLLPDSPVVRISHAGEVCAYACFRPTAGDTMEVEFQLRSASFVCQLDFELSRVGSPSMNGQADTRQLGLAMTTIQVSYRLPTAHDAIHSDCLPNINLGNQNEPWEASVLTSAAVSP